MSKSHSLRLFDLTLLGTSGRQEIMITIVFNRMGPVDYMWLIIRCNRNTLVKKNGSISLTVLAYQYQSVVFI